jgi:hypothetical protein
MHRLYKLNSKDSHINSSKIYQMVGNLGFTKLKEYKVLVMQPVGMLRHPIFQHSIFPFGCHKQVAIEKHFC